MEEKKVYTVNEEIDCIGILKYLDKYAGKEYCGKNRRTEENKKEMEEKEKAGRKAKEEFEKMYEICKDRFKLIKSNPNSWLDQSGQKMRDYLWIQLKLKDKKDKPESISLFVEPSDTRKTSRFRFSLEIRDEEALGMPGEMEKYHKHLELPLNADKNLVYISTNNTILNEPQEEVIKHVKEGKYKKVQISRVLEWDEDLTNKKCIETMLEAVESLMPYYKYVINDSKKEKLLNKMENNKQTTEFDKNMILYGPPGTGKTYSTVIYAVAICDNKSLEQVKNEDYKNVMERYKQLKDEGRIEFTTFHQSYGYEEFIEGIKPIIENSKENEEDSTEENEVKYTIEPGIFKKFCKNIEEKNICEKLDIKKLNPSPSIWKVSLKQTGNNDVREECMKNGHIRIGYDQYGSDLSQEIKYEYGGRNVLNAFISKMQKGDIILSCYSEFTIDAIGIVTGDYEWNDQYKEYKRLRKVDWLVKDLDYNILDINGKKFTLSTVYQLDRVSVSDVLKIVEMYQKEKNKSEENPNYVFIIDEINRGNISKIFGELITLIEPSKRLGEMEGYTVKLPYSKTEFGVPSNVYLLGTMNTADRSIALLDTALRRRFQFIEMMPETDKLKDIKIGEIDVAKMLDTINKRIEILYDREHTIGHSIFMSLKDEPTLENLANIFKKSLIPLLKEYFYEDYAKIQLILGEKFVKKEKINVSEIFKINTEDIDLPEEKYTIMEDALNSSESYIEIYE